MGKILFDISKGLQSLHLNGIIHRDIKPQNILVSETGAVLSDFDFSEFDEEQSNITFHTRISITTEFAAPEVLTTRKHTIESDLFSLGITIGNVLVGCPVPVLRSQEEFEQLELTLDQKSLVLGLTNQIPTERTPLTVVLKNPFIRGDQECSICTDTKMISEGVFVGSEKSHFMCHFCLEKYIEAETSKSLSYLMPVDGEIKVPFSANDAPEYFSFDFLCKETSPEVVALYLKGKQRIIEEKSRIEERKKLDVERLENQEFFNQLQKSLLSSQKDKRKEMLAYLQTEKALEKDKYTRLCPNCHRVVQKIDGCRSVLCGRDYHGGNQQSGCGTLFDFHTAPRYKSRVENLDQMIRELSLPTRTQLE
jgi:serine/threonine protein kinase